jgi:hypothetical protein
MKKLVLSTAILFLVSVSFAQSEKYVNAMKGNIAQLDSMMIKGNSVELANNFERIADAEKTQWLPYYYAAYCTVIQAMVAQDKSKNDAIADKAQELINKADSINGKENSETDVIKAMIGIAHMVVDPQSRYMTYGPQYQEMIEKSESLDSTNPRPVLLQAQNTFYTPEQFGGGKDVAKPMFEKAKALDDAFKPETELSPNWGRTSINYFLSQYQ